jgi:mycofactocin precursor
VIVNHPSDRPGACPVTRRFLLVTRGGRRIASLRPSATIGVPVNEHESEEPVVEETLVEEVSIDGMCGVY